MSIFSLCLLGCISRAVAADSHINLNNVLLDNEFLPEHMAEKQAALQRQVKSAAAVVEPHAADNKPAAQVMDTHALGKPHDFDVDRYLNDFDALDCDISDPQVIGEGRYEIQCAHKLEEESFMPLSHHEVNHESFFNYLNSNIYMPLAYNIPKPFSLSESLLDLISLNSHTSLVEDAKSKVNYNDFENSILTLFHQIQEESSTPDEHPKLVMGSMLDILKKFHLYWNQLRGQNQIDKAKNDTKEIMRNLLKQYQVKERFMFELTKEFVQHIKTAYIKFIKAHQFVKLINRHASAIISHIIVFRYDKLLEQFKQKKANEYSLIKELVWLLDLQEAFYIVNYRMGLAESKSIIQFHGEVLEVLKAKFNTFMMQNETTNPTVVSECRNFTAIILLKMRHKEYLIFVHHTVMEFANMSKVGISDYDPLNTKVYYELLDSMRMIPRRCSNYLILKSCAFHETNKIIKYLGSKYMLNRSSKGWVVFMYIQHLVRDVFKDANDNVFADWKVFKTYFYRQLFRVMYNFKKRYQIGNDDSIADLESQIGQSISHFKTSVAHSVTGFQAIDQLDKELYDKFLDIKADYGRVQDFQTTNIIQGSIGHQVTAFFNDFAHRYDLEDDKDMEHLESDISKVLKGWSYKPAEEEQADDSEDTIKDVSVPETLANMIQKHADKLGYNNVKSLMSKTSLSDIDDDLNTFEKTISSIEKKKPQQVSNDVDETPYEQPVEEKPVQPKHEETHIEPSVEHDEVPQEPKHEQHDKPQNEVVSAEHIEPHDDPVHNQQEEDQQDEVIPAEHTIEDGETEIDPESTVHGSQAGETTEVDEPEIHNEVNKPKEAEQKEASIEHDDAPEHVEAKEVLDADFVPVTEPGQEIVDVPENQDIAQGEIVTAPVHNPAEVITNDTIAGVPIVEDIQKDDNKAEAPGAGETLGEVNQTQTTIVDEKPDNINQAEVPIVEDIQKDDNKAEAPGAGEPQGEVNEVTTSINENNQPIEQSTVVGKSNESLAQENAEVAQEDVDPNAPGNQVNETPNQNEVELAKQTPGESVETTTQQESASEETSVGENSYPQVEYETGGSSDSLPPVEEETGAQADVQQTEDAVENQNVEETTPAVDNGEKTTDDVQMTENQTNVEEKVETPAKEDEDAAKVEDKETATTLRRMLRDNRISFRGNNNSHKSYDWNSRIGMRASHNDKLENIKRFRQNIF